MVKKAPGEVGYQAQGCGQLAAIARSSPQVPERTETELPPGSISNARALRSRGIPAEAASALLAGRTTASEFVKTAR